jgi:hypothetical protein
MKAVVELVLDIEGSILKKFNTIHCREDDLPSRVHDWMTEIIWDTGFRDTNLVKAVANEELDLKDRVNELRMNPFV